MPQISIMTSAGAAPPSRGRWKGQGSGGRESNAGNRTKMQPESLKALLAEGDSQFASAVRASLSALTGARIELQVSETLDDALRRIRLERFDAILLDLFLSDSQGVNTFARIHSQAPTLPVVIVTSCDNDILALESVRQGAQDYVVKSK